MQAEFPNDKSTRYTLKAAQHLCTLYDASYVGCLELRGAGGSVAALLDRHRDRGDAAASPRNRL